MEGGRVPRIGGLEQIVMETLWGSEPSNPITAREVATRLPDHAYTTVLTVLDRLERKGLVVRSRGRVHRFAPTRSRARFVAELMAEALFSTDEQLAALRSFVELVPHRHLEVLRRALGVGPDPGGPSR